MHIIVIGGGKLGATLVDCLIKEGHDIALIDTNYKLIENIVGKYDVLGICGNGANVETLKEAGVARANVLIAATASDEVNILCALVGKKLGAHHTVARVRAPEYADQLVFMRNELGISMMINPERETANEIARLLRSMRAIKIDSFARGRADLVELRIAEDSPFCGMKLFELYGRFKFKLLICAIQRGDDIYIPDGNFKLEAGDKIHVTASHNDMEALFKLLGFAKSRVRTVLIIGGGTIALYLARELIDSGMRVKIIELSEKRCEDLSEKLPGVSVICGNGNDDALLDEEGMDKCDACVALTGIDEENIIISLAASMRKIPNVVLKVNNASLLRVVNSETMDNAVSPKNITANSVVRYVRSKQSNDSKSVQTLYKFVDNKVEAVEFIVPEGSGCTDIPLKRLKLKRGLLVACIVRGNQAIIPCGDDVIKPNDNIVIVSKDLYLRNPDEILD